MRKKINGFVYDILTENEYAMVCEFNSPQIQGGNRRYYPERNGTLTIVSKDEQYAIEIRRLSKEEKEKILDYFEAMPHTVLRFLQSNSDNYCWQGSGTGRAKTMDIDYILELISSTC